MYVTLFLQSSQSDVRGEPQRHNDKADYLDDVLSYFNV